MAGPRIALLNDTSSISHFGCQLVVEAIKANLNVVHTVDIRDQWGWHYKKLREVDLVVVNGEGSLHHGRRMELLQVADFYPSVLINAVYQEVPENDWLKKFQYVAARESQSAGEMRKHGADPQVVPDLIFSHHLKRGDGSEGQITMDSVIHNLGIGCQPTNLPKLLNAESIVSGRFHATCIAMMTGIPFTAYGTNTWKTEAMLKDAGLSHLYDEDPAIAANLAAGQCPSTWIHEARQAIADMFKTLTS